VISAPTNLSEDEERFGEIAFAYLRARDEGHHPDPREWLARYAEFGQQLASFFADQEEVDRLGAPLREMARAVERPSTVGPDASAADADPAPPAALPRSFGDYDVLEEMARGGMGVVYLARQRSLNRLVALKVIRAGEWASSAEVRRFRNEAEMVALLDHPHVVPIHEVGEQAGHVYFSMKLIEGGSLAQHLSRFWDDPRAAAGLVAAVARAVHHAHQRGVLHRDLKPSNILLDENGRPHVTDFGLARRVEADSSLTQSGAIVGTPGYMAPEQTAGKAGAISTAADVYGLGAVLYALLTGRPPFAGDDPLDTLTQIRQREPEPPRRTNPKVDRDLETICLKCLRKEPAGRYASALALAEELQRWLNGEPIRGRRSGRWERAVKWVRRRPTAAALLAVTTLAAVGLFAGLLWHNAQLQAAAKRERQQAETARWERDVAEEERRWSRRAVDDMYTRVAENWLKGRPHLQPVQCEFLNKALQFYRRAADQAGDDPEARREVASASHRLGTIQKALARHGEAQESFRRAVTVFNRLAAEFPNEASYRRELSASHDGIGQALQATGRYAEAAEAYRHAADLLRRLVHDFPGRPDYQSRLGGVEESMAMVLAETGKVTEAEQTYGEARQRFLNLVAASGDKPEYRNGLASVCSNLGNLLINTGRGERAEASYREALGFLDKLSTDYPREPEYRERWASNLSNLGAVLARGQRLAEAEKAFRQGAGLLEKLTADYPDLPDYQWEWAAALDNLVLALKYQRRLPEAEAASARAVAAFHALATRFSTVPEYRKALGEAESNRGRLLARMNKTKDAEEAYRQAAAILQKLTDEFPEVPEYRDYLLKTYSSLGALLRGCGRVPEAEALAAEAARLREKPAPAGQQAAPRKD
jgi:tetratricopeptide (TPR) repeat protein/predicted Ser/Thr protein kinase